MTTQIILPLPFQNYECTAAQALESSIINILLIEEPPCLHNSATVYRIFLIQKIVF